MDIGLYVVIVLVFAAVIFLLEGVYLWWTASHGRQARRIEQRLRAMSPLAAGDAVQLTLLKERTLSDSLTLQRLLKRVPHMAQLDRFLAQSGLDWSAATAITYSAAAGVAGAVVADMLLPGWTMTIAAGVACAALPWLVVGRARLRRLRQLEAQLPEAADLMSRALRSGHAFPGALQMVGNEMPEPIAGEFRIVSDEINYGVALSDALQNLARRVPLTDVRYFVIAVLIQRESGGNLAEILDSISSIIRERLKLLGRVRVLSAEGRMSAWILGLLPFAVGLLISVVHPRFIAVLWNDPLGIQMTWSALGLMVVGVIWMRKIIQIHV